MKESFARQIFRYGVQYNMMSQARMFHVTTPEGNKVREEEHRYYLNLYEDMERDLRVRAGLYLKETNGTWSEEDEKLLVGLNGGCK
jgi:hypothetical protein